MKKYIAILIALASVAVAQTVVNNAVHRAITISTATINGADTALTAETKQILWSVEGADIRVTFDGSDPSGGHLLVENSHGVWSSQMWKLAKFVRDADVNGIFHITEVL